MSSNDDDDLPRTASPDASDIADLQEAHSEVVLNLTETIWHLVDALESRTIIGQALGVCMERYSVDAEEASRLLARVALDQGITLQEAAQHLVDTSNRPPAPDGQ